MNQKLNRGTCLECGKIVPNFDLSVLSDKLTGGTGERFFCNHDCYTKYQDKLKQTEELKKEYHYLTEVNQDDYKSKLTTAAKNIRLELKRNFSDDKFKVKTERYSMGNNITVTIFNQTFDYYDYERIRKITNKYLMGEFDGMTDSYNYKRTVFNSLYGETKFIFLKKAN